MQARNVLSSVSAAVHDRSGVMGVQFAMLAVILLGFIALGVEVSTLFYIQKKMQNAADAAVVSASTPGLNAANKAVNAKAVAAANGFTDGAGGVAVVYNEPPLNGAYAGNADAQEVVITKAYSPVLISLFKPGGMIIKARASTFTSGKTPGCLLALATTGTGITLGVNGNIINSSCQVMANSTAANSLVMASSGTIAGSVYLAGGLSGTGMIGGKLQTYGAANEDPYASMVLPAAGSCLTGIPTQYTGTRTINPGRYCSGINIANNASITMNPGVYFVDNAFTVGNNAVINATGGVTVILNSFAAPLSSSNFSINNNAIWNITAPLTGAIAGVAFVAQPNLTGTFQFSNNAVVTIIGAIYMPRVHVSFQGQATTTATSCSQLIALTININSTVNFKGECPNTAVRRIGNAQPHLVE